MAPHTKGCSEAGHRKRDAALRYYLEMQSCKVGWGEHTLVYDQEMDLFRFGNGRFAISCDHVDRELLKG